MKPGRWPRRWQASPGLPGLVAALAGAVLAVCACGAGGFDPISKVDSVRLFAARADKPYARPGDTVNLEVLAFDGRPVQTPAMQHYFIPFTCVNPQNDAYYACFLPSSADAGAPDAAAAGGAGRVLELLQDGQDITPLLVRGTRHSFKVPEDAVISRTDTDERYGLTIVFTVACAGRVVFRRPSLQTRQQVPLACVDADGIQVSAKDYVLGIMRVYVYDTKKNENPGILGLVFDGKPVDPSVGIQIDRCSLTKRSDCPQPRLDTEVPADSWEIQTGVTSSDGKEQREQIWVDYYTTLGEIEPVRLLYDVTSGRVSESGAKFTASAESGHGVLFAVVHDNRGGVAWTRVPLLVR